MGARGWAEGFLRGGASSPVFGLVCVFGIRCWAGERCCYWFGARLGFWIIDKGFLFLGVYICSIVNLSTPYTRIYVIRGEVGTLVQPGLIAPYYKNSQPLMRPCDVFLVFRCSF